ncbi:MAG TPA: asparagine--tRNA ligase [Cryomorphaceae bacterium]|nr:asparagine--tRNA ligase [Cryomorphaceae bacterium]|tara:strand:+ start:7429 stop:8832 length:1404 start_codon:yes stop_codon:yes gene_type:complete
MSISKILQEPTLGSIITVKGWIRSFRSNKFIAINDGSCLANLQCVVDFENEDENELKRITTGACVAVTGVLTESQGKGQSVEIIVQSFDILGDAPVEEYPLQPKKHSLEFLREIAHLRPRSKTFGAVFRIRHALSFAIHDYFNKEGFFNWHSPIITGSDAEGAGEMFRVTTLPHGTDQESSKDFFGKETHLTVSGQLEGELGAMGLGKIYTFGPTFRAENSNTTRHLAEFWMIEPEMAFYDLEMNIDLAEDFLKRTIKYVLDNCRADLEFLDKRFMDEQKTKPQNERSEQGLIEKLEFVVSNDFVRLSYNEAIEILRNCKPNKKKKFKYLINEWGADLQSEHERYLVEKHFKAPVVLFDYPANIKAFYMRLNEDEKTVRAMDILFPGIGEIVGGSQREERYDVLKQKVTDVGIPEEELWWYLETRKFGTCVHSGFGLGFERLVLFATGMGNIRDVIPFPRAPKSANF